MVRKIQSNLLGGKEKTLWAVRSIGCNLGEQVGIIYIIIMSSGPCMNQNGSCINITKAAILFPYGKIFQLCCTDVRGILHRQESLST